MPDIESAAPTLQQVARILDRRQIRLLLNEALHQLPKDDVESWEAIAQFVNGRCAQSTPKSGEDYSRAVHEIMRLERADALLVDMRISRKVWLQMLYDEVEVLFGNRRHFLNFGYESATGELSFNPEQGDFDDRSFIELYMQVLKGTALADKKVLEVGCGWGGGSAALAKYLKPVSLVALDFLDRNIAMCKALETPRLKFEVGDATNLRFADNSFDVVISLQSSHAYEPFSGFASETHRVLAPRGRLVLGDVRGTRDAWDETIRQLEISGLNLVCSQNLTDGIIRATANRTAALMDFIESTYPDVNDRRDVAEVMALPGSTIFDGFMSGQIEFRALAFAAPA